MDSKPINALCVGDIIRLREPPCTGTVTAIDQSKTEIRSLRGKFGDALMIRFRVRDGKFKGMSLTDFAHPDDKVEMA